MRNKAIWGVCGAAVLLCGALLWVQSGQSPLANARVVVSVDGKTVAEAPLNQDQEIPVLSDYGTNVVRIEGGAVYMLSSSCEDQDCVHQGKLTLENHTQRFLGNLILCLPNRVIVTLEENP